MLRDERFDTILRQLEPTVISAYARAKGWRAAPDKFDDVLVFGAPDGGLAQLIVPRRTTLADRLALMRRALERLAQYEERSIDAVLDELASHHADVLALSVSSNRTEAGFLPLSDAANMLAGARRALQAAAHSVLAPELTHHARMSRTEVEEFIRQCEMGQTRVGSFVLSIRCADLSASLPLEEAPPFSRRAVEVLHRSVARIVGAVEEDRPDRVNQDQAGPRITDNLCAALLMMQPEEPSAALTWSVQWDLRYPADSALKRQIEMRSYHFDGIEAIYQELQSRDEADVQRYDARVDELKGETGEDGRRSGLVGLSVLLEEEIVKASIRLGPDDYEKAIRAHRGSSLITVHGKLRRARRSAIIDTPHQFELMREISPTH